MTGKLVVGTAALGMAYGLARLDGERAEPGEEPSLALVRACVASGLDTFDTAPAYGHAERRLGLALGGLGRVWTKLAAGRTTSDDLASVGASVHALRRPRIELLQWHNWTPARGEDPVFRSSWAALSADPRVQSLGASTYGAEDALAAVSSGWFQTVQVEWNLLRQSVVSAIAPAARARGVRVAARSVLLQGALTDEQRCLPASVALAEGVERARRLARDLGMSLEQLALRAALSHPDLDHVLVGLDRLAQVEHAAAALAAPTLPPDVMRAVAHLDMGGDRATDPRTWRAGA